MHRILDALHLALTIQAVYTYTVTGFGDIFGIVLISWYVSRIVSCQIIDAHSNQVYQGIEFLHSLRTQSYNLTQLQVLVNVRILTSLV